MEHYLHARLSGQKVIMYACMHVCMYVYVRMYIYAVCTVREQALHAC